MLKINNVDEAKLLDKTLGFMTIYSQVTSRTVAEHLKLDLELIEKSLAKLVLNEFLDKERMLNNQCYYSTTEKAMDFAKVYTFLDIHLESDKEKKELIKKEEKKSHYLNLKIEGLKQELSKEQKELLEKKLDFHTKSIEKLNIESQKEYIEFNKDLQNDQRNFFRSTTLKNYFIILITFLSLVISFISMYISIIKN
jgi:hypothetical protein